MIGQPGRLGAPGELLDALQVIAAERLSRAEVHRDTMLHDLILIENLVEYLERLAAVDHVVFGDDLKPVDDWLLRQDVVVMRNAQSDTYSVICESVEAIGWHGVLLSL